MQHHLPEITLPFSATHETAAHLLPVLLPTDHNRTQTMAKLRDNNIQSSIHYPPIHLFSYYRAKHTIDSLPNTEYFCAHELSLPLHPSLDGEDIERVVSTLSTAVRS